MEACSETRKRLTEDAAEDEQAKRKRRPPMVGDDGGGRHNHPGELLDLIRQRVRALEHEIDALPIGGESDVLVAELAYWRAQYEVVHAQCVERALLFTR